MNSCRLYLRVLSVSDISDPQGLHIRKDILDGTAKPLRTKLLWPRQDQPSKKAWTAWRKAIRDNFIHKDDGYKLYLPLGNWTRTPDLIHDDIIDTRTKQLLRVTQHTDEYQVHSPVSRTRTKFHITSETTNTLPTNYVPTTVSTNNNYIRRSQLTSSCHSSRQHHILPTYSATTTFNQRTSTVCHPSHSGS